MLVDNGSAQIAAWQAAHACMRCTVSARRRASRRLLEQGNASARANLERALDICETMNGAGHPSVARACGHLGAVLQDPNGTVAVVGSFFPFTAPMLMMARVAVPPGAPWWQPPIGVALVLRIRRLIQQKLPSP